MIITRYDLISLILRNNELEDEMRPEIASMKDSELKSIFCFFTEIRKGYYLLKI